jgi:hypothetical protein
MSDPPETIETQPSILHRVRPACDSSRKNINELPQKNEAQQHTAPPSSPSKASVSTDDDENDIHRVKWTKFLGRDVPIICQNTNGPCPLLAIVNILLLERRLTLHKAVRFVSASSLVEIVANLLIETNDPSSKSEAVAANLAQTLSDVIATLPKLRVGLDVNVRFTSTTAFEYTVEGAIFDLLDINLVHGWILDQQDESTASAIGDKSYNQLVEIIINARARVESYASSSTENPGDEEMARDGVCKSSDSDDSNSLDEAELALALKLSMENVSMSHERKRDKKGRITPEEFETPPALSPLTASELQRVSSIEEFLERTQSQLTYVGLLELHQKVKPRELCVFFRNNHFSTMFKRDDGGSLFLLATDEGYADQPLIVWERLEEIDGDTELLNADFSSAMDSIRQEAKRKEKEARTTAWKEEATEVSKNRTTAPESGERDDDEDVRKKRLQMQTDHDLMIALSFQEAELAAAEEEKTMALRRDDSSQKRSKTKPSEEHRKENNHHSSSVGLFKDGNDRREPPRPPPRPWSYRPPEPGSLRPITDRRLTASNEHEFRISSMEPEELELQKKYYRTLQARSRQHSGGQRTHANCGRRNSARVRTPDNPEDAIQRTRESREARRLAEERRRKEKCTIS